MIYRITTILLAGTLLLVLGVNITQSAPSEGVAALRDLAAPAGIYDYTNHGTAWVPQLRQKFSMFQPVAWGTQAKVKVAGKQWVHIPVPYPARIADTLVSIKYVEFCAQSSNGAVTKPIRMALWDYAGKFYAADISWPDTNSKFCIGHEFNPPIWKQDLGVSVLLDFKNTTDKITLYKAWVRVTP